MDNLSFQERFILAAKRLLAVLGARIRRVLGSGFQIVMHDQLGDLSRQTRRLGSASVESVSYMGRELRALDERLTRIEEDLSALRELLEGTGAATGSTESSEEVAPGPTAG